MSFVLIDTDLCKSSHARYSRSCGLEMDVPHRRYLHHTLRRRLPSLYTSRSPKPSNTLRIPLLYRTRRTHSSSTSPARRPKQGEEITFDLKERVFERSWQLEDIPSRLDLTLRYRSRHNNVLLRSLLGQKLRLRQTQSHSHGFRGSLDSNLPQLPLWLSLGQNQPQRLCKPRWFADVVGLLSRLIGSSRYDSKRSQIRYARARNGLKHYMASSQWILAFYEC